MIIRLIMRKAISKGIDAGIKGASNMGHRRKQGDAEIDEYGQPTGQDGRPRQGGNGQGNGMTKQQVRQARQAARVAKRMGKM
ncbi:hypothetical protein [Sulfitobacter sp. 20_GPM-1509m]|uniref:hypothetical protein n=1 Tax=Sulfitobacter sp. 20_GPM-1509m TaxID=1380367 RepID=UPI0012DF3161|nr:hypothetical protein [Sulfitobacter sp. 20_GPM-1509m]